jgi:G3E family GTPase
MTGKIPLHILTGFLGSGKTTLLNRIVREPALGDSAILINEIGAIALDHHLVRRMDRGDSMDIVVLQGGCTCCAVRGDLVEALRELYAQRANGALPPFSRAILETTGLADPAPVLFTLVSDPVLRHKFEAGGVTATVDAVHGAKQLDRYPECRKQVAVADRLIITKGDIAEPGSVAALTAELTRRNPAAEVLDIQGLDAQGLDALASVLATSRLLERPVAAPAVAENIGDDCAASLLRAEHTLEVAALAFTLDDPIEWSPFSVWLSLLLHAHGENILRFKALLNVLGWSGPVMLDGIHHLIHAPIHLPAWPDGERNSRIVVIAQRIAMPRIESSLRDFLATHGMTHHKLQQGHGSSENPRSPSFLTSNLLS